MTAVEQHDTSRRKRMPAAERRESILAAATVVFTEAGYQAAKVAEIAARVGVSEPVVFQNFGSKPALFTAVLERAAGQASASMEDAGVRFGSAGGLLAHVLGHAAGGHGTGSHGTGGHPASGDEADGHWAGGHTGGSHEAGGHGADGHTGGSHEAGRHPGSGQGADGHGAGGHHGPEAGRGRLFAVAVALAADPAAPEARVAVLRTLAGHLAGVVRHGQRDGSVRADAEPEAASWLLVSLLATGPLRRTAAGDGLESAVAELAGRLFSPDAGHAGEPGHADQPGQADKAGQT